MPPACRSTPGRLREKVFHLFQDFIQECLFHTELPRSREVFLGLDVSAQDGVGQGPSDVRLGPLGLELDGLVVVVDGEVGETQVEKREAPVGMGVCVSGSEADRLVEVL